MLEISGVIFWWDIFGFKIRDVKNNNDILWYHVDDFVDNLTSRRHWNDGNWIGVTIPRLAELFKWLNHDEIDPDIFEIPDFILELDI